MQSSWLFLNPDELFYRFHLAASWLWDTLVYVFSLRWLFTSKEATTQSVFDKLSELGLSGAEAGDALRAMRDGGLSNSDMLRLLSDVQSEGLLGAVALRAIENASFADYIGAVSETGSGLFRIFGSRPSSESDSISDYLNPVSEQNSFELLWSVLTGGGDKESIFSVIFGTFLGWFIILSVAGWFLVRYIKNKLHFMEETSKLQYDLDNTGVVEQSGNEKSVRWQRINEQVNSGNEEQMRVAIIDADILLEEVLTEHGYAGSTVGERLQDARQSNVTTVEYAAEAHGVRNKIAHIPGYVLSEREAKQTIGNFERFFNELYHL